MTGKEKEQYIRDLYHERGIQPRISNGGDLKHLTEKLALLAFELQIFPEHKRFTNEQESIVRGVLLDIDNWDYPLDDYEE